MNYSNQDSDGESRSESSQSEDNHFQQGYNRQQQYASINNGPNGDDSSSGSELVENDDDANSQDQSSSSYVRGVGTQQYTPQDSRQQQRHHQHYEDDDNQSNASSSASSSSDQRMSNHQYHSGNDYNRYSQKQRDDENSDDENSDDDSDDDSMPPPPPRSNSIMPPPSSYQSHNYHSQNHMRRSSYDNHDQSDSSSSSSNDPVISNILNSSQHKYATVRNANRSDTFGRYDDSSDSDDSSGNEDKSGSMPPPPPPRDNLSPQQEDESAVAVAVVQSYNNDDNENSDSNNDSVIVLEVDDAGDDEDQSESVAVAVIDGAGEDGVLSTQSSLSNSLTTPNTKRKRKKKEQQNDFSKGESSQYEHYLPPDKVRAGSQARAVLLGQIRTLPVTIGKNNIKVHSFGNIKVESENLIPYGLSAEQLIKRKKREPIFAGGCDISGQVSKYSSKTSIHPIGFSSTRQEYSPVHGRMLKLRCDILGGSNISKSSQKNNIKGTPSLTSSNQKRSKRKRKRKLEYGYDDTDNSDEDISDATSVNSSTISDMNGELGTSNETGPFFRIMWGRGIDDAPKDDTPYRFDPYSQKTIEQLTSSSSSQLKNPNEAIVKKSSLPCKRPLPVAGMRCKVRYDDEQWYGGSIMKVSKVQSLTATKTKKKSRRSDRKYKICIEYDDGTTEEEIFPDPDIQLCYPAPPPPVVNNKDPSECNIFLFFYNLFKRNFLPVFNLCKLTLLFYLIQLYIKMERLYILSKMLHPRISCMQYITISLLQYVWRSLQLKHGQKFS